MLHVFLFVHNRFLLRQKYKQNGLCWLMHLRQIQTPVARPNYLNVNTEKQHGVSASIWIPEAAPHQSMWKEPRSWFLFFIKVKTPHVVTPLFPNSWSPRPLLFSDLCDVANTKSSDRFILGGKCLQGNVQNTSICSFSSPPHLPPFS